MKTSIEVELEPFTVPNCVSQKRKRDGVERPPIPLANLSPEALERLCDVFRDAVFHKAGKLQPPRHAKA